MKLLILSSNGNGAGKSQLARTLSREVWSLAGGIRDELAELYPAYNWRNTDQKYKDKTLVEECGGKTVRQVMIDYGQGKCASDPTYWVDKLIHKLQRQQYQFAMLGCYAVAVDDTRKLVEASRLKAAFPGSVHLHLHYEGAVPEPQYDNEELAAVADYTVLR